jgi:thiosulfate/3-mercaptopyruvate sulfurtransferase
MAFHHRSRKTLIFIAALAFTGACAGPESQPGQPTASEQPAPLDTLVTTEWLSEHLDDPDLVVLDCTVRVDMDEGGGFRIVSGRADYESGHISSAGFADLMGDLSDGESPLGFAMPTPEQFATAMGALGVGDDSRVVLYDTWTAEERPLSTEPVSRQARQLTPAPRPELIADRDEVLAAIDNEAVWIIDALPEESYRGEMAMYDRPGHIPGASNIPAFALLDEVAGFLRHPTLSS